MTPIEAIELINKLLLMADFTDEYGDMCDSEPYEEAVAMASSALTELRLNNSRATSKNTKEEADNER